MGKKIPRLFSALYFGIDFSEICSSFDLNNTLSNIMMTNYECVSTVRHLLLLVDGDLFYSELTLIYGIIRMSEKKL